MNPERLQGKVEDFAQRLLQEANGDPIRALGLLVLILDEPDFTCGDQGPRLIAAVRKVLMPDEGLWTGKPVQHLAGAVSWEGVQHCLRCAKVLGRDREKALTGYVYEIGPRFTSRSSEDFEACA